MTLRKTMVDKRTIHVHVEFEANFVTLRETMVDKRTIHVYVEFEAKFGELWAPRQTQKSHFNRKKVCAC